jgi:alpha-glucosidase
MSSSGLLLAIVGACLHSSAAQVCTEVYPHLSCGLSYTTETDCIAAGCCWDATPSALNSCFAPKINGYSYEATATSPTVSSGTLSLIEPSGMLGPDFTNLTIDITQETADRTHIKIVPSVPLYGQRWEVPETLLPRPGGVFEGDANSQYVISSSEDDPGQPMEVFVTRIENGVATNELIFILSKMLVFQDQYLEFVLGTPPDTAALFGVGESTRAVQQLQANSTYTLWNTDIASAVFDVALYGTHPFLIQVSATGKSSGILFMNSNAMDVSVFQSDSMGNSVGVQSTGGVIDLYVFAGPTPADVVKQFLEVVGKPAMIPYWSLGFHNCKWGYVNTTEVADVVANYSAANIPLETQWVDIDYMHAYLDFTLDPTNFPEADMTTLVNNLHANDQYFVPIVDPGIYVSDPTNPSFVRGVEDNVFVKDINGVNPYLGGNEYCIVINCVVDI